VKRDCWQERQQECRREWRGIVSESISKSVGKSEEGLLERVSARVKRDCWKECQQECQQEWRGIVDENSLSMSPSLKFNFSFFTISFIEIPHFSLGNSLVFYLLSELHLQEILEESMQKVDRMLFLSAGWQAENHLGGRPENDTIFCWHGNWRCYFLYLSLTTVYICFERTEQRNVVSWLLCARPWKKSKMWHLGAFLIYQVWNP